MPVYLWSQSPSSNQGGDPTINWAEGQAPSTINNSARAMMAETAKWRDDISGSIVTTGTSTAYAVTSNSQFDSLAHLNRQVIAFSPHITNAAGPVTLNVDGLGAKPLRTAPNADLLAGVIIQGTPYAALYNNADGAFYLQGLYGNPYNVPLLGGLDFWDTVAPNSAFIFAQGQAISRTTYAAAFARWGITFGPGDGSTTFNVPDKRGRVSAMIDAAGSRLTGSFFPNAGSMGMVGGSDHATLGTANLPPYTPAGSVSGTASSAKKIATANNGFTSINATGGGSGLFFDSSDPVAVSSLTVTGSLSGTPQGGTSTPFGIVPPTITCNYIIRII